MSPTVLERDMLKTRVDERDMCVTTFLSQHVRDPMCYPWKMPINWRWTGGRSMRANLSPVACRLSPAPERCPDCGQPAPMCRKGKALRRCGPCSLASLRARHRAYDAAHQQHKAELRRCGGIPCPPYEAWDVEAMRRRGDGEGEPLTCVVYGARGRTWPEALVTFCPLIAATPHASRLVGACSCGQAGCVHLVVALLAQSREAH